MINVLGLLEVDGMVAAIDAADAMLKAANVRLLSHEVLDPGRLTLVVEGDLAACRAANAIKERVLEGGEGHDVVLVEIGGTVGDIESLPFLEAIRQMAVEIGREHTLFMHLTLVPYMAASGEVKTKPTQHSVKELLSIGIQPDILICRSDRAVPANERAKIALFCNVPEKAVISLKDVDSIYKIPGLLKSQGLDDYICKRFSLNCPEANLSEWEQVIFEEANPVSEVTIGMVGKYIELPDAYKSVIEALKHGGLKNRVSVNIKLIDSQDVETRGVEILKGLDAILVPGGFGYRGVEGMITTARFARENNIPYLGICLGMQVVRPLVETIAAVGQTFPPVAVLAIAVPVIGFGLQPAIIALILYGVLPVLQATLAGLGAIDASVTEVAKGMGMSRGQRLRKVELPLAAPVILAGVRTSVIINIGTATIASTVGASTLGTPIIIGLSGFNTAYVIQGALLVALAAIIADRLFERLVQALSQHAK